MKKFHQCVFLIFFSSLLLGCAEKFCSLNCAAPTQTPIVTEKTVDFFAEKNIQLMPKGESLVVILPTDLFFRKGSPTLKNDRKPALDDLALLIQRFGSTATVQIRGYTDQIASNEQNQQLSLARARAVLAYFWSKGLDADHLYALGYGANHLVGDPNNVDANAANRRIEIIIHAHCTTCF